MYQVFPYIYLLICSLGMLIALGLYSIKFIENKGIKEFILLLFSNIIWILCQMFELMAMELEIKLFWANLLYIGICLTALSGLLLALRFAGYDSFIKRKNIFFIALIYTIFIALIFTDQYHGLMRNGFSLDTGKIPYVIDKKYGRAYPVYLLFSYSITFLSLTILFISGRKKDYIYRRQCIIIFIGMLFVLLLNVVYILKIFQEYRYDFAPGFFIYTSLVYFIGITRHRFFYLTPIARNILTEKMQSGMVVFDNEDIVVDLNSWMIDGFEINKSEQIGAKAIKGSILEKAIYNTDKNNNFSYQGRTYSIKKHPIYNKTNKVLGKLYLVNDITHTVAHIKKLYEQEKTLEIMKERERIGRELHDELGQIFSYYNTKAQTAQIYLDNHDYKNLEKHTRELIDISTNGHAQVRSCILQMRGVSANHKVNFLSILKKYIADFSNQSNMKVDILNEHFLSKDFLDDDRASQVLKIIQEALTNARKHAGDCRVVIKFAVHDNGINIIIEDNGKGFDRTLLNQYNHYGIAIMKERATEVDCNLEIESQLGKGTKVTLMIENVKEVSK